MTLNELAREFRKISRSKGWKPIEIADWSDDYRVPTALCLIHSEVSEALEAFRKGDIENFDEEIADILIRTLEMAGGLMDIDYIVSEKTAKNRLRSYKHGGKRI